MSRRDDERFMRRALELAARGRGRTRPNPMVGAVIVRGGRVLAEGFHRRAGGDHGEVAALRKLGFRARGATVYVNLEPCCHEGRTGPCTSALIEAGVARVVAALRDPNPRVDGRGFGALRAAGVRVDVGLLEDAAFQLNRGFLTWVRTRRPWVTVKAAMTVDGFIAASDGKSKWITGAAARRRAHELRAEHDAILVGAGTVRADDPALTVRLPGYAGEQPLRVVVDGRFSLVGGRWLALGGPRGSSVVLGGRTADPDGFKGERLLGDDVHVIWRREHGGHIPVPAMLDSLGALGVRSVLVEGGAGVIGSFLRSDFVDELQLFVAPKALGGGLPVASGRGRSLGRALALGPLTVEHLGQDLLIRARVAAKRRGGRGPRAPRL